MTTEISASATFTTGHALVIGVGSYAKAPTMNVPITAEDARQVAALLTDPRYCAYPQAQVTLLTDGDATRQNILDALDRLATTTRDATVLLFYSGHGAFGDDGYYLTTNDTELADEKVVASTGVRETELLARLNAIPAQRAVLIFNACHSGAIAPNVLGDQLTEQPQPIDHSLPNQLTTALLGTGAGRVVITACKEEQKSYFVRQARTTLFAQALVDTLQGRGIDSRRGYISVFDLYDYVYDTVNREVKRRWELDQEPVLTIHQGVGAMAVALYQGNQPEGSLGPQDRPEKLGGAVREVDPQESAQALQQILAGTGNLAAGRDISGNTIISGNQNNVTGTQNNVTGDQIDARGSQGFNNRTTGPITQTFGPMTTIDTGGGDNISTTVTTAAASEPGISEAERLFKVIYQRIDSLPPNPNADKDEVEQKVRDIHKEATTAAPNQSKLERWLGNLAEMSLDIFNLVTAALSNPTADFAESARTAARQARSVRGL